MDQDSFRQLLKTPRVGASSSLGAASRSRGFVAPPPKVKVVDASQPAFKPRNMKKAQDSKYRDRAAERRVGDGNDYAHVEALLEDFEKRNADNDDKTKVEAQRKYLGGDSEHSILVKGLDFALLEQNKAKATISAEDVDALDQAFLQSSSSHHEPTAPKKRTREDIIRELKEQRTGKSSPDRSASQTSEVQLLEEAKQRGKFKPIGFKPIGSSTENKRKKTKTDNLEKEEKKKKRKPNGDEPSVNKAKPSTDSMPPPSSSTQPKQQSKPIVLEEPIDHDFDIFADAGEYEGIDIGDDDDDEDKLTARPHRDDVEEGEEASTSSMPRRWISGDEPVPILTSRNILPLASGSKEHSRSYHGGTMNEVDEEVDSDEQPMRLAPLASSVLPSIKDLLAMDKAASSYDKKKKRNDKKSRRGGDDDDDDSNESKKKSVEAKVDRDYKRLKTYTDKKALSEKS